MNRTETKKLAALEAALFEKMVQLKEIQNPAYTIIADSLKMVQGLFDSKSRVYEDSKSFNLTALLETIVEKMKPFGIEVKEVRLTITPSGVDTSALTVDIKRLFPESGDKYDKNTKYFYGSLQNLEKLIEDIHTWASEHYEQAQKEVNTRADIILDKESSTQGGEE